MESYLPLLLLLVMLLLVGWQILLDFISASQPSNRSEYRGLNAIYHKIYRTEITGGRIPDSLGQHVIDVLYRHRFGWFLLMPAALVFAFLFWVTPWVLENLGIDKHSLSAGTLVVAVLSLPIITFVWFIRAYERDRELTREEADLWSSEFDRLMKSAASGENEVLQRAAIRQLQDYLSGGKWRTNQRSNSTAVFELFSSIVDEHWKKLRKGLDVISEEHLNEHQKKEQSQKLITSVQQEPVLITIGAVLRAVYGSNADGPSYVRVSQDSLANFHFDLLDLTEINLSQLNITGSSFEFTDLSSANFFGAVLASVKMSKASLYSANLSRANLWRADLSEADISHANVSLAYLPSVNLSGADLSESNLSGTGLHMAKLSGANFSEANLSGAFLAFADVSRTTKFSKSNLVRADLMYVVSLSNTDMSGANLTGCLLKGTGLYKEETLKRYADIKYDDSTKWDVPKKDEVMESES